VILLVTIFPNVIDNSAFVLVLGLGSSYPFQKRTLLACNDHGDEYGHNDVEHYPASSSKTAIMLLPTSPIGHRSIITVNGFNVSVDEELRHLQSLCKYLSPNSKTPNLVPTDASQLVCGKTALKISALCRDLKILYKTYRCAVGPRVTLASSFPLPNPSNIDFFFTCPRSVLPP
jgi:hypothetical protein